MTSATSRRGPRLVWAPLVALLSLAVHGASLGAQGAPARTRRTPGLSTLTAPQRIAAGDALHAAMRPMDALRSYQAAASAEPAGAAEALWKSAREAVDLGMLSAGDDVQLEWYRLAEGYARRAIALDPDESRGFEWLAIALGRAALSEGPRTRVRMAEEVYEAAVAAVAADTMSAGAHHVLGQWHAEVRRLSSVERFLARHLMGGEVMDRASWDEAERHLRRATELAPGSVIHHVELARVFRDTGRSEPALEECRRALALPPVEPVDALYQEEARRILAALS